MLDINTKVLEDYSKKLESLSRSALPVAVRESLNDCARDMKMNTLMKTSKDAFINRSPSFFKANSAYERAEGFSIPGMKATAGMTEGALKGDKNHAVKDLEDQEEGGSIDKKSFIPNKQARTGNNPNKMVRANARLKAIKNIIKSSGASGKNDRQKFIKSVYFAGKGGFVLDDLGGKKTLFRVNSLNKTRANKFKLTPLYSFDKGRSVKVKATHFVSKAGDETHRKIDDYYISRAEKTFEKHLR